MGAVERLKTQAVTLGFAAVVIALLFVAAAIVPFDLLPLYLGGWFVALMSLNIKGTRFAGGKTEAVVFVADGVALFLFVAVGFLSFVFGDLPTLLAAGAGFVVVAYSMSL